MCAEHATEKAEVYCFECHCPICFRCTIKKHNYHHKDVIDDAAPKLKEELLEKLVPLKKVKVSLLNTVNEIQATKSEVEGQVGTVTTQVQVLFKELQEILENRKQQLIKKVEAKAAEKQDHLSVQERKLSESCAALQIVIADTEQCIGSDVVVSRHAEIQNRIEKEIAEHAFIDLYPTEEADIGVEVSCVEDLKQLCQTKAKLTQCATEYTVSKALGSGKVGELYEFCVAAKLGDGKQVKRKLSLDYNIKSLADGSTEKGEIDRTENIYRIRYTPTVRGWHEITLTAPGSIVDGSPLSTFISIDPLQLTKPVTVITEGFDELPLHVAISSIGEVIVTGENTIVIFDRKSDWKKLASVNFSDKYHVEPWGVAADDGGTIYIPGRTRSVPKKSCIVKLTSKLEEMERSDEYDTDFREAAVVGDKLMVCDEKENQIIMFTKDLALIRRCKAPEGSRFIRDMSSDNNGNLYACGWDRSIHVFNSDTGDFLRSFAGYHLASPRGICAMGGYVYLTDTFNNDILVYDTTKEKYITSFKKHCSEYTFARPWGVRADQNGFIFICDSANIKLVMF